MVHAHAIRTLTVPATIALDINTYFADVFFYKKIKGVQALKSSRFHCKKQKLHIEQVRGLQKTRANPCHSRSSQIPTALKTLLLP